MDSSGTIVRTWMATQSSQPIDEIVLEIISGSTSWLHLVKSLGEYLTSQEEEPRRKGVEFLSLVLGKCPADKLTRQSTNVLITFMCSKLDDYATQVTALKGLLPLVSSPTCLSDDAVKVAESLFQHVQMKSLVQSERLLAWSIMDRILSHHREALKKLEPDFVASYVTFAEGEKDPRNLVIAFALARVILIEFDTKPWVESLFNITFCYFPIAYRPPQNDPYHISTDDLRIGLRGCLSALPDFGPLALPVFLEKLIAGSPIAKRDTLETMSICLPIYGSALARNWARKLWNSLKLEIFQPTDNLTESMALSTVQVLVRTIYADESTFEEGLAKDACEECLNILKEPEKSQAKPAIKVLCSFVGEGSTLHVAKYTISQVIPHLLKLFTKPEEAPTRGPTLMMITELLVAVKKAQSKNLDHPDELSLDEFKDEMLGVLTSGLNVPAARIPALKGLQELVTMPRPLLTKEELGFVVHSANQLMQEEEDDVYRDDLLALLVLLSKDSLTGADQVESQVLSLLFASLPDSPPSRTESIKRADVWKTLDSLGTLCLTPPLFEVLVIRLVAKLDVLFSASLKDMSVEEEEPMAAYAHSILKTISKAVVRKISKLTPDPDVSKYIDKLVPRLFRIFVLSSTVNKPDGRERNLPFCDLRLLTMAGQIITDIIRVVPAPRQEIFVKGLFDAYLNGSISQIMEGEILTTTQSFEPFTESTTIPQKNMIILFASAVVPLRKEVLIPVPVLSDYLLFLLDWGLNKANDNNLQRDSIWRLISCLVNKKVEQLGSFLQYISTQLYDQCLSDQAAGRTKRLAVVDAWGWITKSLLIRSHPLAMRLVEKLFPFLDDPDSAEEEVRWKIARLFGLVVSAASSTDRKITGDVLTKRNYCVVKVLFAQKFVHSILPRIMDGSRSRIKGRDESNLNAIQVNYLVALTSLVTSVPKSVYVDQIGQLMPMLLLSLDLPDANIRVNVMKTLITTFQGESSDEEGQVGGEIKKIVTEHASKIVASMVQNIEPSAINTTATRTTALSLLSHLPQMVDYSVLHPLKSNVLKHIGKSLDDPKRLVRKEAVDARTVWFRLGGRQE